MISFSHIKNDFRQIIREPIMLLLFILPLFYPILFKLIIIYLIPYIGSFIVFNLNDYYSYILSLSFVIIPSTLGAVTGFMMLDEKDGQIVPLLSVTPLGKTGYIINRLSFGFLATLVYTIFCYYILDLYQIPFLTLIILAILLGINVFIIGSLLFILADDKVKGLTYAKSLNIIVLFALSDLVNEKWLSIFSMLFPTYWITKIIQNPYNLGMILSAFFVHIIWLILLILKESKSNL